MEQSYVENLDRRRYRLMCWQTVSTMVWLGIFLYSWMFEGVTRFSQVTAFFAIPMFAAAVVCFVSSVRMQNLSKEIRANPRLDAALNDELYVAETNKAIKCGYFVTLGVIALAYSVSIFYDIPGKVVAGTLFYVGVLAGSVAKVIIHHS